MQYAADHPYWVNNGPSEFVLGHFTVSGLDNEVDIWDLLHRWGYMPGKRFPDPHCWFGWARPDRHNITPRVLVNEAPWNGDLAFRPWMLESTPAMFHAKSVRVSSEVGQPDWRYRVDYIRGHKVEKVVYETITNVEEHTIDAFAAAMRNHRRYAQQEGGAGLEIIGLNNLGEVTLHAASATQLDAAGIASLDQTEFGVVDLTNFPSAPFRIWIGPEVMEVRRVHRHLGRFEDVRRGMNGVRQTHSAGAPVKICWQAIHTVWWRELDSDPLRPKSRFVVPIEFEDLEHPMPAIDPLLENGAE
jgi:hypothetical protein